MKNILTKNNWVVVLIALFGVIIAFIQFVSNRSLWLDEAMLALNIINRDYSELLLPLDYTQVAPILFLLTEKFFTNLINGNEWSLRIFPLLCYFASIPLFYKVTNLLTRNGIVSKISLLMFCCTPMLIFYSSETKQYMTDVFVTLLIYFIALSTYKGRYTKLFILSFWGGLCIFLSNISVIILFCIGLFLLFRNCKERKTLLNYNMLIPCVIWGCFFLLYYLSFIQNHPSESIQKSAWRGTGDFLPHNPFNMNFWNLKAKEIFGSLLGYPARFYLYVPVSLFYLSSLFVMLKQKKYRIVYFLTAPIIVHLILSYFEKYPFANRLILYQIPLYIITISLGLFYLYDFIKTKTNIKYLQTLFFIPVVVLFIQLFIQYPIEREEIKKSISYVNKNISENELVYIYYASVPAFLFYKQAYFVKFDNKIVIGKSHRGNDSLYIKDLSSLSGKVWILFSHVDSNEDKFIIDYLQTRGKLLDEYKTTGSSVYLFNL
ncbi:MAG: glycosyltransferase family 39 protein [Bacteroidales bacterium]|nr:glycosyltransferase family 39 protein [Bacteroidales bacterium]